MFALESRQSAKKRRDEGREEVQNCGISTVDVAVAVSMLHQQHLICAADSFSMKGKSLHCFFVQNFFNIQGESEVSYC